MAETMDAVFVDAILRLFAFDYTESLWWRGADGPSAGELEFFVNCNDFFAWGTADCEKITPSDLPALRLAFDDADEVDCREEGPTLWVARKRGMQPQGAVFGHLPAASHALYGACGPPRAASMGNPITAPISPRPVPGVLEGEQK